MSFLINDKHFKKFLNAKKYLIMFGALFMEIAYEANIPYFYSSSSFPLRKKIVS